MTLILLISFLWAYLEGKREAQYFHYKWSLPSPTKIKDEHFDFAIQRSLYVLKSSLLVGFIFNWLAAFILFISIALTFSFFHNGSYYKRRNEMNKMWKEVEKNACGMELKYLDGKKNLRLTIKKEDFAVIYVHNL
jgi:hypothetical protein